ncbi:NHL domain-containing protein [Massilia mucilaginosa]|nr:hypothetical protein [Massilia mucilaginosa]
MSTKKQGWRLPVALVSALCVASLGACGGGGKGDSSPAETAPFVPAPAITAQPLSQSVQNGQPATFTIAAGGAGPFSYQWNRNGVAIPGATGAGYTVGAVQLGDNAAIFSVNVRNAGGNVESTKASLTVIGTGLVSFAGAMRQKDDTGLTRIPARPLSAGLIDGPARDARFYNPKGVVVDAAGNVFVADSSNHIIRKITPDGVVSTLAGNPVMPGHFDADGAKAGFHVPTYLGMDAKGTLYVFDQRTEAAGQYASLVRKVSPAGEVQTLKIPRDPLNVSPAGTAVDSTNLTMAVDAAGNVYIAAWVYYKQIGCESNCDSLTRHAVRRIAPDGTATTLADLSSGPMAGINLAALQMNAMVVDSTGAVYISDTSAQVIWKLSAKGMYVHAGKSHQSGTSDGKENARFSSPGRMVFDKAGNLFVIDNSNTTIRRITPSGVVTTVAGTPGKNDIVLGDLPGSLSGIGGIAFDANGVLYVTVSDGVIKVMLPPAQ